MIDWRPLHEFVDPSIPKIDNLRRAQDAGVVVPPTWWLRAADVGERPVLSLPEGLPPMPWIIRSGSPTEDTFETSNAGQLLSVVVRDYESITSALHDVVAALPHDDGGRPLGCAFIQPLVNASHAGVAFFDGFYFERTMATGSNEALTSGQARGAVERGHLQHDDLWSDWLCEVYAVFADAGRPIDIEFARLAADRGGAEGFILLQSRPALFRVQRNPTLSLANHKEILGDPPSPWIMSVLLDAGKEVLKFFSEIDPHVATWEEDYAVEVADRAWMNFSFFFRLMDRWGLPRNWVTVGAGGQSRGPADDKFQVWRFLRSIPQLIKLQYKSMKVV